MGVPEVLDHILLGCSDLERGIAFVEERTGVRAAFGGVHPGRGTQNALLSLGERHYLEIIAPDPKQAGSTPMRDLRDLTEPRLIGWAAHPGNIKLLAAKLVRSGIVAEGPTPGSRKRPDGSTLHWETLTLQDDARGLLPFFIEWSADSMHPSVDSPKGCQLADFGAVSPSPETLAAKFQQLGVEMRVNRGDKAQLRAHFSGPKGEFEVSS